MHVKTKIILSNAALLLGVTIICLIIVHAVSLSNANRQQLQKSYEQLQNVNHVASAANRFSEQVAELTILGLDEVAAAANAGRVLRQALDQQFEVVEAEIQSIVNDPVELQREREEQSRINVLLTILSSIQSAVQRIEDHLRENDQAAAVAIYRDEIEELLDTEMDRLIASLQEDERKEINNALVRSNELSQRSLLLVLAVMAIAALMTMANAYLINRTIARPLVRLAEATDAVTRGEFAHEIKHSSPDEFGELGNRFNLMIRQLSAERERVQHAQTVLEQEVAERTADLATANTQLREIDNSRASFLADISHELRTPLTVLRGQAEVALRDPDRPTLELRHTLERIVAKSQQIGRLVNDLLLLSRSESGSLGIDVRELKLQDVIADVLLDSEQLSRRSRISISARQPEEPVLINGDAQRLRQAVLIGLDNAIKHAPERSIVDVELTRDKAQAHITIRDQGPGFREEELNNAFKRFYRGSESSGRTRGGLGLGLSIAKWITDQHQGTIGIENAVDKGAVIRISLPLKISVS